MKKTSIAAAVALLSFAMIASASSTPDGCIPGNGGSHPICTPTGGGGNVVTESTPDGCIPNNGGTNPCIPN